MPVGVGVGMPDGRGVGMPVGVPVGASVGVGSGVGTLGESAAPRTRVEVRVGVETIVVGTAAEADAAARPAALPEGDPRAEAPGLSRGTPLGGKDPFSKPAVWGSWDPSARVSNTMATPSTPIASRAPSPRRRLASVSASPATVAVDARAARASTAYDTAQVGQAPDAAAQHHRHAYAAHDGQWHSPTWGPMAAMSVRRPQCGQNGPGGSPDGGTSGDTLRTIPPRAQSGRAQRLSAVARALLAAPGAAMTQRLLRQVETTPMLDARCRARTGFPAAPHEG